MRDNFRVTNALKPGMMMEWGELSRKKMKKTIFFFLTIFFVIAGIQNLKAQFPIKLDFLEKAAILSKDKFTLPQNPGPYMHAIIFPLLNKMVPISMCHTTIWYHHMSMLSKTYPTYVPHFKSKMQNTRYWAKKHFHKHCAT